MLLVVAGCGRLKFELLESANVPGDGGGDGGGGSGADGGALDAGGVDAGPSDSGAPDAGQAARELVRFFRASDRVTPQSVGIDASGGLYVGGAYRGSLSLDPDGSAADVGPINSFVARYDRGGLLRWARGYGGTNFFDIRALAVDGAGTSYSAGLTLGQSDVGGTLVDVSSDQAAMVIVHDSAGGVEDVHLYPGISYNAQGRAIDVSPAGIALGGVYGGDVDFGGGRLGAGEPTGERGFAAVFDPSMAHVWSRGYPDAPSAQVFTNGAAVASDGRSCFTGRFDTTTDFGGGPVSPAGDRDIFVALYGAGGALTGAVGLGGAGSEVGWEAAFDPEGGGCVVVGHMTGPADFGAAGSLPGRGGTDAVVAYVEPDPVGTGVRVRWARSLGGSGFDGARAVTVDDAGTIYVTGEFQGDGDFGGLPLSSRDGGADAFVVALDSAGVGQWARRFGGAGTERGLGIAHDAADGAVAVVGFFEGETEIVGSTASPAGARDGFLYRFVP
jgi:hypothetical protein